jgi:methionine aminopeptidase
MNNLKVTYENEIKSTEDIISEAIEKAHRNFSMNEISDFIEKYIYLGNGHLLVIEALIENGFYKEARTYFQILI